MTAPYVETMLGPGTIIADGPAKPTGDKDEVSIQVSGIIAGDKVQIEGSNDEGLREDSGGITHWSNIPISGVADITVDGIYTLATSPRWLRARRTDITGGGSVVVLLNASIT